MLKYLRALAYGVGGLAAAGLVLLVIFQERLVYVPVVPGLTKAYPFTPARARLQYEDVWLTARDGVRLHAWFLKLQPANAGPTIVFFQENAGNIAHRLDFIAMMMLKLQCNVFMLSYRGYRASDGFPSQHGIILDAQASLDHLLARPDIDSKQIVLFGRSLGGAVATQLTANNPGKVAAIVLENTFTSVLDMAGQMLPFLGYLVGTEGVKLLNPLVRSPWRTVDIIASVHTPVLFLAGLQDEMVPPAQMRRLFEQCKADPRNAAVFVEFRTGAHMDTWVKGGERYWRVLELFLRQHVMEQKQPHGAAANGARSELSDELSGQRHAVL